MRSPRVVFASAVLALILGMAAGGLCVSARAQDGWGEEETKGEGGGAAGEEEAWRQERAKLEEVINARVEEEVKNSVSEKAVAEMLHLAWPVRKPPKEKDEIAAQIEKELEQASAKTFPDSTRREFEKEAEEKYRIHEVGETVAFMLRGGQGPNAQVKGKLYDKTTMRLKVGGRYILRDDMEEESQARFWEDTSDEFRKKLIRVRNVQYDGKIKAYQDQMRATRLPEALRAARYICDPRKPKSLKLENWHAEADVLDAFYKRQSAEKEKEIRPQITEQVFTSNGFVLVEDEINGTKEWMPKKEAASFRERIRELLAQRKSEEAANKAAQTSEWGATSEEGMEPAMAPEGGSMGPGPGGSGQPAPYRAPGQPGGQRKPGGENPFDDNQW
ncbi:MAG: hypothetical protein JXR77_18435 [Lentisphaeria bacterium]|nr:hypothetical protein [Lentisphaeria bacterium]